MLIHGKFADLIVDLGKVWSDNTTTMLLSGFVLLLLHCLMKDKKRRKLAENKAKSGGEEKTILESNNAAATKSEDDLPKLKGFPVIGSSFLLGSLPHEVLAREAAEEFDGKIFRVQAGCRKFVVFTKYDDIMYLAKNYPEQLFGKPHSFTTGKVTVGAHNDLVERWKKRRAYTNAGLKHLEKYAINDILEEEIGNMVSYLDSLAVDSPQQYQAHDVRHELTYYVSRVLYRMSYGEDISRETEATLKEIVHHLPDYTTAMGSFSLFDMFPFLRFFDRSRYVNFIKFNKTMMNFCRGQRSQLDAAAAAADCDDCSGGQSSRASLWSFFKEKFDKVKNSSQSSKTPGLEDFLIDGLEDIIRAGTESTSLILQWFVLYIAKFPQVQAGMQAEIDQMLTLKNKKQPDLDDTNELPYCRAVMAETLRYSSLNPFLKRQLTGDLVTKDGYHLKEGTSLLFNNWALNYDPVYWSEPNTFEPRRFLNDLGGFDNDKLDRLLTFGFGKRRCIGVYTGRSLCFLAAISIIHRFKLNGDPHQSDLDLRPINGIGLSPKPFKVAIESRR